MFLPIWILLLPSVDLQIAVPVYPVGPQIYALPPPPPVAIPIPVPIAVEVSTTTTTTTSTTEKNNVFIAVPAPYPVPVPVVPQPVNICFKNPRPKNCPQCPPCLPPAPPPVYPFIAYPIVRPNPVIVVPFPPPIPPRWPRKTSRAPRRPQTWSLSESSSSDSSTGSSTSSEDFSYSLSKPWTRKKNKHGKKRRSRKKLKNNRFRRVGSNSDELFVKPVLSYISKNGDVKLKHKLSKDDAAALLDDGKEIQNVKITGDDSSSGKIKILSEYKSKKPSKVIKSQARVRMKSGSIQHELGEGKKEIVFKPFNGRKITNLSVSFQVT